MINNFDSQIHQLEELIAKYNTALDFFKNLRDTGEITVENAMKAGLVWVEINENGKITNKELKNLNQNAVIKEIESISGATMRCTELVD